MYVKNYSLFLESEKGLTLYRGEEKDFLHPQDDSYKFFAEDQNFAEDYGDYVYKCTFKPMNIFSSLDDDNIRLLYKEGFKLRDEYVEMNKPKDILPLYDFEFDNEGYKTAEHFLKSPYSSSDTWEVIEHSHGVLDFILSKYDGVLLVEGGQITYYLDTSKIISCILI